MQTYLKTRSSWVQLFLFLGMAFGIFIVLSLIGMSILSAITGINMLEIQRIDEWDPNNPRMIFYIRGLLLIQFLGLFVIPSLLFSYFSDPQPLHYAGLRRPYKNRYWVLGIVTMLVALPAAEYLGLLNQQMSLGAETQSWMKSREEEAAKQIQFMLSRHTVSELLLNTLFIAVFAGVGEELFFRGILQRIFIRAFKSPWAGIVVTAILFSAFHFQFFGFLPRVLLGIVLGAIYWYSGSLWTAIFAHFFYDALIIVVAYFNPEMLKNPEATLVDPARLTIAGIISIALTVLLILQMKRSSSASYAEEFKDDKPKDDIFTF
ncbi:MAG TPA: CPBP family intramembrane glutamic endopeptidase [Flavisolibacter sp.]|nr:CPBP family intramembrane glutamic endopeptidase [Flavisolibacter sp.]